MRREDYPLCPYCFAHCCGFCNAEGKIIDATLYCSSATCKGGNLGGHKTGYDIKFTDLKVKYDKTKYPDKERIN